MKEENFISRNPTVSIRDNTPKTSHFIYAYEKDPSLILGGFGLINIAVEYEPFGYVSKGGGNGVCDFLGNYRGCGNNCPHCPTLVSLLEQNTTNIKQREKEKMHGIFLKDVSNYIDNLVTKIKM